MSSKRERKEDLTTDTSSPSTPTSTTTTHSPPEVQRRQQQEAHKSINKTLDVTKDNIRKATDEARREIPSYTQAINEYQQQTIQAAREIVDDYIESQKEIINSLQSTWLPQIETVNRAFTASLVSPRHVVDNYARVVSSMAYNTVIATRLVNSTIFANLEMFNRSLQNAIDNVKEISRIGVNSVKTFEQVSRVTNTAAATTATTL
jgi:hypothetical protein